MPLRRRKPGLGHYNAPRREWYEAYRIARIAIVGGGSSQITPLMVSAGKPS